MQKILLIIIATIFTVATVKAQQIIEFGTVGTSLTVEQVISTIENNDITDDFKAIILSNSVDSFAFSVQYFYWIGRFDLINIITNFFKEVEGQNVESIEYHAFNTCESLATVNFPNAINIGIEAFNSCESLIIADFPKVITIEYEAFIRCENLKTVNFPSVINIGFWAFAYCKNLIVANFPSATNIEYCAFAYCENLTTLVFPNVTHIGGRAFDQCSNLIFVSLGTDFTEPTIITLDNLFGQGVFHNVETKNIDLCLGENVLPLPNFDNNTWNGHTWKSINEVNCDVSIQGTPEINFTIFPNPANDKLTIHHSKEIGNIGLYDLSGRLIRSYTVSDTNTVLDISDLDSGVYFLTVDGKTVKFIKKEY